jgi:hypothetical protein
LISNPAVRNLESAARVVCACQPNLLQIAATPTPVGALNIRISCARFVASGLAFRVARASDVASGYSLSIRSTVESAIPVSFAVPHRHNCRCYRVKPGGPGGDALNLIDRVISTARFAMEVQPEVRTQKVRFTSYYAHWTGKARTTATSPKATGRNAAVVVDWAESRLCLLAEPCLTTPPKADVHKKTHASLRCRRGRGQGQSGIHKTRLCEQPAK